MFHRGISEVINIFRKTDVKVIFRAKITIKIFHNIKSHLMNTMKVGSMN